MVDNDAVTSPPQHCPGPRELDDLELLVHGVLPDAGFGDLFTLEVSPQVSDLAEAAGALELVDPEGVPLASVTPTSTHSTDTKVRITGPVTPLQHNEHGAFRSLYLGPDQARSGTPEALTVPVAGPLTDGDLGLIRSHAADRPILLLALVGHGTPTYNGRPMSATALIRATLAAARLLDRASVVAVPLASRGRDRAEQDHELGQQVVAAYATGEVLTVTGEGPLPDAVQQIVDFELPAPYEQGLVLFFTGLSGSGKSTLARALHDVILERGERTVTSLDGDVVRRNLSAGLTFSREDRETNNRRIGWVAAEISRHRGVAICSPIAPFDATRQQVRSMVEAAGGAFFLVHVATPVEECERRDRKGLYAKARRGEIPEFTGISSPYEEPNDADVRVDTTERTIDDVLSEILNALDEAGYLPSHRDGTTP